MNKYRVLFVTLSILDDDRSSDEENNLQFLTSSSSLNCVAFL